MFGRFFERQPWPEVKIMYNMSTKISHRVLCSGRSVIRIASLHSKTTVTASGSGSATTQHVARPYKEIPGPQGPPYFGNVHSYVLGKGSQNVSALHQGYFEKYGSIFKETLLGMEIVHVNDLKDTGKIFRFEGKYPKRPSIESWIEVRKRKKYSVGISQM